MLCTHNKKTGSHQNGFELHIQVKRNYSERKKQSVTFSIISQTKKKRIKAKD